jgi:Ca2+-binding RTX toxin-like protein
MSIKNLTSGFVVTPSPTGTSHDFRVDLLDEDDFNVLTQGDRSKSYEINGNADDNTITGGDQDDQLYGAGGYNYLYGGKGDDTFVVGTPNVVDFIYGQAGNHDTVDYSGADTAAIVDLSGNYGIGYKSGNTEFYADIQGVEDVRGSAYDDYITGDGNANTLRGNSGDDTLFGSDGADTLNGGDGADILDGGAGADVLEGGGNGGPLFNPLDGADTAYYGDANGGVTLSLADGKGTGGDANGDTFFDIQNVTGSAFADTITGNDSDNQIDGGDKGDTLFGRGGDDTLNGDKGDDFLIGGSGADTLNGDAGSDTADYSRDADGLSVVSAVTVSLKDGGSGGNAAGDTYNSVENVIGTNAQGLGGGLQFGGDDTITGNGANNVLNGLSGNDTLDGAGGADTLIGGLGVDTLTGGAGVDTYAFNSMQDSLNSPGKFDTITNFESGEKIDLSAIDANPGAAGDQAFTLVANFTGNAGEVRSFVDQTTGDTIVQAYDGTDTFQVDLTTSVTLTTSNFVF